MNGALYCVLANDLLLFLPGILDYGADDEVVYHGTDKHHGGICEGLVHPKLRDEKTQETPAHHNEIEQMRPYDAYNVLNRIVCPECPVDGKKIIDAQRNQKT
jgi:hypothetical protein